MPFSTVADIGAVPATPRTSGACSVSSAIALVAGSFFSEKYSDTPFEVRKSSFDA